MTEVKKEPNKKIDLEDLVYYAGLVMLFIGLALSVSIGTALTVVGSVLAGIAVVNSYIRIFLRR